MILNIILVLLIIIGLIAGYYIGRHNGNLKGKLWERYLTDIARVSDEYRDLKIKVSKLLYDSENVEQRVRHMISEGRRNEEMMYNPMDLNRQLVKYLSFLYQEDAKKHAMKLELEKIEEEKKEKENKIIKKYE